MVQPITMEDNIQCLSPGAKAPQKRCVMTPGDIVEAFIEGSVGWCRGRAGPGFFQSCRHPWAHSARFIELWREKEMQEITYLAAPAARHIHHP